MVGLSRWHRPQGICAPRRAGFSLAELVVAIGILLLMFALAGQVFTLTIQSTGQAAALTEVNQMLRAVEQSLREDLRHVQPGQSLLLIQGNPVNAYWTRSGPEADDNDDPSDGYPHPKDPDRELPNGVLSKPRADILMFFTAQQAESKIEPDVVANLQQVVYGHAELGKWALQSSTFGPPKWEFQSDDDVTNDRRLFPIDASAFNYPSTQKVSRLAAQQWHLARRSVLLLAGTPPTRSDPDCQRIDFLDDPCLLDGRTDYIGEPPPRSGGGLPAECLEDDTRYCSFAHSVLQPGKNPPWFLPEVFGNTALNFAQWRKPFARSRLDPSPPAALADRLGHFFLPHCASFKVEWTLDPHSRFVDGRLEGMNEVVWFDPGVELQTPSVHPLQSLQEACEAAGGSSPSCRCSGAAPPANRPLARRLRSLHCDRGNHPDGTPWSMRDRFLGTLVEAEAWEMLAPDRRPNLVVFGAARRKPPVFADAPGEIVPEVVFPSALRITIDVYDREGRLERPVRHVMVIPVGG